MKSITLLLSLIFSFQIASGATSDKVKKRPKVIQDALAHATAEEKKDLVKMLESIEVTPLKQKFKGQTVFRVRFVEKGSAFDRAGIERGDLVTNALPQRATNPQDSTQKDLNQKDAMTVQ